MLVIPREKDMPLEEAIEMVQILSAWFEVNRPVVIYHGNRRKGVYTPHVLHLNRNTWTGPTTSLLHEFAHHLEYTRHNKVGHGLNFHVALTQVAQAWYGDPQRYNWHLEYNQFQSGPVDQSVLKRYPKERR